MWPQVKDIAEGRKYELLISGKILTDALDSNDGALDDNIFDQTQLNFLRLSQSSLSYLPDSIDNLANLTHLELQCNAITHLPNSIVELTKLKLLDVSENLLESLPSEVGLLKSLVTLNVRQNALTSLIGLEQCSALSTLDISMNKLVNIEKICFDKLVSLSTLLASHNEIEFLPGEFMYLANLKTLNVSENRLKVIPSELAKCSKLKDIDFKGNPLTDRRFKKLVESDRGHSKLIIDYLRQHCKESNDKSKNRKGSRKNSVNHDSQELLEMCHHLSVLSTREGLSVTVDDDVRGVRDYLVCCILRGLDLDGSNLKTFVSGQTKLHDTVCEKRLAATIATHDLSKIRGPLTFSAKRPDDVFIHPLGKHRRISATEFLQMLKDEADLQRKQMKRNSLSGIHKYLSLVDGLEKWPCLLDATGVVISLPPISNSNDTKIDQNTGNVLVEVTSNVSLKKAKEVMESVISLTLDAGICRDKNEDGKSVLTVEQVRIYDQIGGLRLVFPAKNDLEFNRKDIALKRS